MMIGAASLILAWGRPMQYRRNGVTLFNFTGRRTEARPTEFQLIESVDEGNIRIIALASDFNNAGVRPQKFDTVIDELGEEYTVQRGHFAGADVDELVKLEVRGAMV